MRLIDLTGQKFNKLTVIERVENRGEKVAWLCRCDCGNLTIATSSDLKRNNTKSCGCLNLKPSNLRHGRCGEFIYQTYCNMRTRCNNKNNKSYKNYGGRGIKVCDEWNGNFKEFYDHVSQLPHFAEPGYTLDRINNNGNYEPGNVRWATAKEQVHNRRKPIRRKKNER